ncbi:hypothetical protein DM860_012227 [Cuscuta australis]|uniref:Uncharacterized protein n=1 Tax=Cuscuta australis TaxID=267555 RepID=A0A328E6R9_9ASTE|nr:hypothetical protein DM860_012227 [Cuscuta australis]
MATLFKSMILTCAVFLALLFSFGIHVSHERPLMKPLHFHQLPYNVASINDNNYEGGTTAYGYVNADNPGHSPGAGHPVQPATIGSKA